MHNIIHVAKEINRNIVYCLRMKINPYYYRVPINHYNEGFDFMIVCNKLFVRV